MSTATWIDRRGTKRVIPFVYNGINTESNIAWLISDAYDNTHHCIRHGDPALYALFLELVKTPRINYPLVTDNANNLYDAQKASVMRNSTEKYHKKDDGTYEKRVSRVGYSFNDRLFIDCDNKDIVVARAVSDYYGKLMNCKFTIIKTGHGHWLRSDKVYTNIRLWRHDIARILKPDIKFDEVDNYITEIRKLVKNNGVFIPCGNVLRASKLVTACNDVDVVHAYISLDKDMMTIRASKKFKNEVIEEVI